MTSKRSEAGFSLLEAIVAIGLMAGALASLGQMLAISVAINRSARDRSDATVLAQQKMEQLLLESSTGAAGLSPSAEGSLTSNMDGWFDVVDGSGQSLGGPEASGGGLYIRRWAIEPLSSGTTHSVVIHVLVSSGRVSTARWREQVRLSSIKTSNAR